MFIIHGGQREGDKLIVRAAELIRARGSSVTFSLCAMDWLLRRLVYTGSSIA